MDPFRPFEISTSQILDSENLRSKGFEPWIGFVQANVVQYRRFQSLGKGLDQIVVLLSGDRVILRDCRQTATLPEQDPIDQTVLVMRNQIYCIFHLSITF